MKSIKDKRGMTLIELVVAMALGTVLAVIAALALTVSFRLYSRSTALSEGGILRSTLYTAIADELRYAGLDTPIEGEPSELRYRSSIHGGRQVEMKTENGYVTVDGKGLLGESAYTGYTVKSLTFSEAGEACIRVKCLLENPLYDKNAEELEIVVRILNGT